MGFLIIIGIGFFVFWYFYGKRYFKSADYLQLKESISINVRNYQEIKEHIQNLSSSYNNFSREEFGQTSSKNICDCSRVVLRNAQNTPFVYLCKYFNIQKDNETLKKFSTMYNQILSIQEGQNVILKNYNSIIERIKAIPFFVRIGRRKKIEKDLEINEPVINFQYPEYIFSYKSPAGKAEEKFSIILDLNNLEKFISFLEKAISKKESEKYQRSLMTKSLREKIKKRDNYTCQCCGVSLRDEPHLLLEIDHIIPVSKGGLTKEDNLQTLCWKCNRQKSNKIS